MEYKPRKNASSDRDSDRKTFRAPSERSAPYKRSPSTSHSKKTYTPRSDKPDYGPRKTFGARTAAGATTSSPHLTRKPQGYSSATRGAYDTKKGERTSYRAEKDFKSKPRYGSEIDVRARRDRPSYGTRTEQPSRPSQYPRSDSGTTAFEKRPGAYGYKERPSVNRPRSKSIPHPRTQSWSHSRGTEGTTQSAAPTTSWGKVANWYDDHLTSEDTYHKKVLLPNVLRLVDPQKNEAIIDLACGQGYFTQALKEKGAELIGVDISAELIEIARKKSPSITYHVSSVEELSVIPDSSANKVVMVLAIQNVEHTQKLLNEVARILSDHGTFHIVMNHPAFRIPKQSSWDYDDKKKTQFRRVDQYLSDSRIGIDMHPGMTNSPQTLSFHRPLQYYFKLLSKAGFAVDKLEEWISHKDSDSGPRAQAENRARKEIPLFLYLRAVKQ